MWLRDQAGADAWLTEYADLCWVTSRWWRWTRTRAGAAPGGGSSPTSSGDSRLLLLSSGPDRWPTGREWVERGRRRRSIPASGSTRLHPRHWSGHRSSFVITILNTTIRFFFFARRARSSRLTNQDYSSTPNHKKKNTTSTKGNKTNTTSRMG